MISSKLVKNLEKLTHFIGIAEAGSIRGYATSHNLSQSSVSKSMKNLEEDLEIELLIRHKGGVVLSQEGLKLLNWAKKLHAEAKNLELELNKRTRIETKTTLKMGIYLSISVYFLPTFLKFIQETQSNLNLNFLVGTSSELHTQLKKGEIDFSITIDPTSETGLLQIPLLDDNYSLYRLKNSRLSLTQASIFTLPDARDNQGRTIESYLRAEKLSGKVVSSTNFEIAKAMLVNDTGYAIIPDRVAESLLQSGIVERVTEYRSLFQFGPHSVVFSYLNSNKKQEALNWVANQLQLMLGKYGR